MWKTTNYKGEMVTWYSEQEYNEALNKYSKAIDTCERLLMKLKEKEDGDRQLLNRRRN